MDCHRANSRAPQKLSRNSQMNGRMELVSASNTPVRLKAPTIALGRAQQPTQHNYISCLCCLSRYTRQHLAADISSPRRDQAYPSRDILMSSAPSNPAIYCFIKINGIFSWVLAGQFL